MRPLLLLTLAAGLLCTSCLKDDLDPAALTTNPFDPAYSGSAMFSVNAAFIETYTPPQGGSAQRFRTVVQVHTEHFLRGTPYWVRYRQPGGEWTAIVSTSIANDRFPILVQPFQNGHQYCWQVQLGNGGSWGAANDLCATAQ